MLVAIDKHRNKRRHLKLLAIVLIHQSWPVPTIDESAVTGLLTALPEAIGWGSISKLGRLLHHHSILSGD